MPAADPKYAGSPINSSDDSETDEELRRFIEAQEQSRKNALSLKMKIAPLNVILLF